MNPPSIEREQSVVALLTTQILLKYVMDQFRAGLRPEHGSMETLTKTAFTAIGLGEKYTFVELTYDIQQRTLELDFIFLSHETGRNIVIRQPIIT